MDSINDRLYANHDGTRQTFIKVTDEGGNYWFNIVNQDGGTESKPYGYTTRERLENLRDQLTKLLDK